MIKNYDGFDSVECFAFFRDADNNARDAFEKLCRDIRAMMSNVTLPAQMKQFSNGNPRIGIFIMPNNSSKGMLENLCLKSVKDKPAMECVNSFFDCVTKLEEKPKKKELPKAMAQAFLSSQPEIVNCVGLGAQRKYWEFDSSELDELKLFIENI